HQALLYQCSFHLVGERTDFQRSTGKTRLQLLADRRSDLGKRSGGANLQGTTKETTTAGGPLKIRNIYGWPGTYAQTGRDGVLGHAYDVQVAGGPCHRRG